LTDNYSAECDRRINQFHKQVSQLQATIEQLNADLSIEREAHHLTGQHCHEQAAAVNELATALKIFREWHCGWMSASCPCDKCQYADKALAQVKL
jgi:response regulator RpfG family c-di-GMP phosphodiesterase